MSIDPTVNNNYRIEFGFGLKMDDVFKDHEYYSGNTTPSGLLAKEKASLYIYPLVRECLAIIRSHGIKHVWWFWEPYVEITWQSNHLDQEPLLANLVAWLGMKGVDDVKIHRPSMGKVGDWFANSEQESRWGERRYARCTELAEQFYEEMDTVVRGKGIEKQVERCIHAICNPLGLTYMDEAKICFSRGLICFLFTLFRHSRAVWIYRNIFRQRY